jgi:hypothetical protein
MPLKYVGVGFALGVAYELTMIGTGYCTLHGLKCDRADDHARLSASRIRATERDQLDAAVERMAQDHPELYATMPERWERIKRWEDDRQQDAKR